MKKVWTLIIVTTLATSLRAQTFDEWFKQKETKIKYMLQQIAANKVYIEYIQKGYNIAKNGLQTISDIKHGDFNLHSEFFNSLAVVNPKIKSLTKVADIILLQIQIIKESKSSIQAVQSSKQLTSSELKYLQNVFDHILDECTKNINDLITVITSGETIMSDDERVRRIDDIYYDMQGKLSFSKSFSADARMLALQRLSEQTDIEASRKINGIQ